jgi:hypothetical protein
MAVFGQIVVMAEMKLPLILGFLAAAVAVFGAPPANVAGMKFQSTTYAGNPYDATSIELLLNADGTYTGLNSYVWRQGNSGVGAGGTVLISVLTDISIPRNGTWTYRVVDQTTAEIVFDGGAQRLHFADGTQRGYVGEPFDALGLLPSFSFDAYNAPGRLVNCSTRCYVASGHSVSFGFVVADGERRMLVRAIGPGLRTFGITQPLANPSLSIHSSRSFLPVDFGLPPSSSVTLIIAANRAGTFPLPSPSDSGKYLTLKQGAYVAEVAAIDGVAEGEVLVEVYQLP